MTRGGPRPGAGRPTGTKKPGSRPRQVNARLSDLELAQAEALGDGNASEGLRVALRRAVDADAGGR